MPTAETFWDKTAERYSRQPIKNMKAYEQTMARTRAHLSANDRVLEIGCGTGSTALLLADSVRRITASDISSKMIEIARNKAVDRKIDNVTFVQATPFDDVLEATSYDAVLAFSILHLLEDTPAAISRIGQLLKPGGLLISKTVCLADINPLWRVAIFIMRKLGLAPFVRILAADELESIISEQGFEVIESTIFDGVAMARFIVARKA